MKFKECVCCVSNNHASTRTMLYVYDVIKCLVDNGLGGESPSNDCLCPPELYQFKLDSSGSAIISIPGFFPIIGFSKNYMIFKNGVEIYYGNNDFDYTVGGLFTSKLGAEDDGAYISIRIFKK